MLLSGVQSSICQLAPSSLWVKLFIPSLHSKAYLGFQALLRQAPWKLPPPLHPALSPAWAEVPGWGQET